MITSGAWVAGATFLVAGGFAAWILLTRQDVPSRRGLAALVFGAGAFLGSFGLWSDARLRAETLFEVVAEGSLNAIVGAPAPVRTHVFDVLHPGVVHTLEVYPEYPAPTRSRARFDAQVRVQVTDAAGRVLVDASHVHERRRFARYWGSARYEFEPEAPGRYTLTLVPLTAEIPAIHARIVDPVGVPNPRRAPGY